MPLKSKVQLMTYPDSLGGSLENLHYILNQYLTKAISGLHILPFYPSTADRGFCPTTHLEVDPKFGEWEDILEMSKQYEIVADLITGHISDKSYYFQDYLKNEANSEYADMFLSLDKIYRDGNLTLDQILKTCYLTPFPPFMMIKFPSGNKKLFWKTFMPQQIELDVNSAKTRSLFQEIIENHAQKGVKMLRLDAVETVCKNPHKGFKLIPETFDFINWLIQEAKKFGLESLCEVFTDYETTKILHDMGSYVYNFHFPDKIFYAIFAKDTRLLKSWFKESFANQITVFTNHDGIAVGETDALNPEQANFTRQKIFENAGRSTIEASGVGANNVSTSRINSTLIEAFFRNQNDWLLASVIHLFAPGIPQVYYNDLLAQRNDEDSFHETGEGRSILRHDHRIRQIDHKFKQPFVQKLIKVMELRNNYPAFEGSLEVLESEPHILHIKWKKQEFEAYLLADLAKSEISIKYFEPKIKALEILEI